MTWEQYLNLDEPRLSEYYAGALVVVPHNSPRHRRLSDRLAEILQSYHPEGTQVTRGWGWSPDGVRERLVPDLMVHAADDVRPNVSGPPALVVDIRTSRPHDDHVAKAERYAAWGAPAYWLVDPDRPVLVTHELRGGRYAQSGRWSGGRVRLSYAGIEVPVDLSELFG